MSQSETTGGRDETALEIRRMRRILKQMHRVAEHSSLTGALTEGATDAVTQYNLILTHLADRGVLSGIAVSLFPPLPPDASFDRLGVASRLLEGYLEEELTGSAPVGNGQGDIIFSNHAGLQEIQDLGRMVRENLPDFLRRRPGGESDAGGAGRPEDTTPTDRAPGASPPPDPDR